MAAVAPVQYPSQFSSSESPIDYQDKQCAGCRAPVDDGDGVVVSFGNSLWHIHCFNCAKCGNRVSADTNILLLSDGSPMCSSCSYSCAVCKKPISHEAIMTGDESYHASCFACRTCGRHITELIFAKTSHGIYCMECHNERVARSKKLRKQVSARPRDSAKDRDKPREQPENSVPFTKDNVNVVSETPPATPGMTAVSRSARRVSTQMASLGHYKDIIHNRMSIVETQPTPSSPPVPPPLPSPAIKTTHASPPPPASRRPLPLRPDQQPPDSSRKLELPPSLTNGSGARRRSFGDQRSRPTLNNIDPRPLQRPNSSGTVRTERTSSSSIQQSQTHLSPTSDVNRDSLESAGQTSLSENLRSRSRSRSRSPSPFSNGHKSPYVQSPIQETPPSPSLLTPQRSSISRSVSESTQINGAPLDSSLLPRTQSLSDPARQLAQSPAPLNSGRISPGQPSTPSGPSIFAQQQSQSLAAQRLKDEPPMRDLPQLPEEVGEDEGLHDDHFTTEEEDESEESEEAEKENDSGQRIRLPMALPPISFGEADSSFDDLLKLGSPMKEVKKEEKEASSTLPPVPPTKSQDPTPEKKVTSPKRNPISLNLLPKRNASLRRNGTPRKLDTPRKSDPSALVLSETFDADMTRDTDESTTSSPDRGPKPLEKYSNLHDRPLPSVQRPASVGVVEAPPSSAGGSRRRSPSVTGLAPTMATGGGEPSPVTPTRPVSNAEASGSGFTQTPRPHITTFANHKRDYSAADAVLKQVKEALGEVQEYATTVALKMDREMLEVIYSAVLFSQGDMLREKTVEITQERFDSEVLARREAEAEVARLRVELSGQMAKLSELAAGERKRGAAEHMSRVYNESLHGLERDVSKLKAERDLTAAEIEELAAAKTSTAPDQSMQRSLTRRFEALKSQYKRDLEPLVQQKEQLLREINELNAEKTTCLETTTALTLRNEELAALGSQMTRQLETGLRNPPRNVSLQTPTTPRHNALPPLPHHANVPQNANFLQTTPSMMTHDDEPKATPRGRIMPWNNKPSRQGSDMIHNHPEKENLRHNFQQAAVLRARCDHCGLKMWGSQLRCTICHVGLHNKCFASFNVICPGEPQGREDAAVPGPQQPSMFGRSLIEQVRAESKNHHRDIPIIVEKCIYAVEKLAMDYEGIYRKTGGSSESKAIASLFERVNYEAIDLINCDVYTDISSVTSVLKTYFRTLPNPLLTHVLHEAFVGAASNRDPLSKAQSLSSLVFQLPSEHFHTLRYLMLHLHRVQLRSAENLMTARNLGVVFGPTLMRSSDPSREFADMAGKALAIEWLIENATSVFRDLGDS